MAPKNIVIVLSHGDSTIHITAHTIFKKLQYLHEIDLNNCLLILTLIENLHDTSYQYAYKCNTTSKISFFYFCPPKMGSACEEIFIQYCHGLYIQNK